MLKNNLGPGGKQPKIKLPEASASIFEKENISKHGLNTISLTFPLILSVEECDTPLRMSVALEAFVHSTSLAPILQ